MSISSTNNTVAIQDVLPWGDYPIHGGRTILIHDSVITDGQFMIYTIVKQFLTWNHHHHHHHLSPPSLNIHDTKTTMTNNNIRSHYSPSWVQNNNLAFRMKHRLVVWITCGTGTTNQIHSTLKRMGVGSSNSSNTSSRAYVDTNNKRHAIDNLYVISILEEIGTRYLSSSSFSTTSQDETKNKWNAEIYLKDLYHRIKTLVLNKSTNNTHDMKMDDDEHEGTTKKDDTSNTPTVLFVLDQLSSLATIVDSTLALKFTLALQGFMKQQQEASCHPTMAATATAAGLVISSSLDIDQEYVLSCIQSQKNKNVTSGGPKSEWIGAGGSIHHHPLPAVGVSLDSKMKKNKWTHWDEDDARYFMHGSEDAWERILIEIADGIIDVLPLYSGYSREIHGRLIFTRNPLGLGWKDNNHDDYNNNNNSCRSKSFGLVEKKKDGTTFRNTSTEGASFSSSMVVNYIFSDHSIQVIRLQKG